jgi:hypothetical protein
VCRRWSFDPFDVFLSITLWLRSDQSVFRWRITVTVSKSGTALGAARVADTTVESQRSNILSLMSKYARQIWETWIVDRGLYLQRYIHTTLFVNCQGTASSVESPQVMNKSFPCSIEKFLNCVCFEVLKGLSRLLLDLSCHLYFMIQIRI